MASLPDFRPKKKTGLPDFRPQATIHAPGVTGRATALEEDIPQEPVLSGKLDRNQRGLITDPLYNPVTNGLTMGLMDEAVSAIAAPLVGLKNRYRGEGPTGFSENFQQLQAHADRDRAVIERDYPKSALAGEIAGSLVAPAAGLKWAAKGKNLLDKSLRASVVGGGLNTAYGVADRSGSLRERLAGVPIDAAVGAGVGLVIPSAGVALSKAADIGSKALRPVSKVFRPSATAEKDLIRRLKKDRSTYDRLKAKELAADRGEPERRFLEPDDLRDAEIMGQENMVADLGGDQTRALLKAATRLSPEASNTILGATGSRQSRQGDRITNTVSDMYGDTLNPADITQKLKRQAQQENTARYRAAENDPKAQHIYTPKLRSLTGSTAMRKAIDTAVKNGKEDAVREGTGVVDYIFKTNADDGLLDFAGVYDRAGISVKDKGANLRFWDEVKKNLDDQIESAKGEHGKWTHAATRLKDIKNQLVQELDETVPAYKTARSGAAEFFGQEDALEMGAKYFNNMDSFHMADARKALKSLSPAERELFSRGYAGQLVTKVSKMGQAEDVNKLFKSPQSRMKMRDALGDTNANMMEAFTHREMVHGLLGKTIQAGSDTAANLIAQEAIAGSVGGSSGYYNYGSGGVLPGILAGIAVRHGFKGANRVITGRYARALAELATSNDPATIARILSKVSKDKGYMSFSRAATSGLNKSTAGGSAHRTEPRLFAHGGRVKMSDKTRNAAMDYLQSGIAKTSQALKATPTSRIRDITLGSGSRTFRDLLDYIALSNPELLRRVALG